VAGNKQGELVQHSN